MKKLLLSLVFAIGISGFAMANNLSVTEHVVEIKKNENFVTKKIITFKYVDGILVSCTLTNKTLEYDICGNLVDVHNDTYTLPSILCGENDGGVIINVFRINNGFGDCPPEQY